MDLDGLEKTNVPGYYKNPKTGVIINNNVDQLEAYRFGKQKAKDFIKLKQEHDALKNRMALIEKAIGL